MNQCKACLKRLEDWRWPVGQITFSGVLHRLMFGWGKTVCGREIPQQQPWGSAKRWAAAMSGDTS